KFAYTYVFTLTLDMTIHHLLKPVMIGEVEDNGQFNFVWQTKEPIRAHPWSTYKPGNDNKPDSPAKSN
ncbi:transporter substrate-binding protein, partial [Pseudomonas syringae group genomosp. 7]|uniref:transporter substrate-binding protein n=1 Tax=Pseudomonas syringae group genomosp. 7 TaxID=251699 RepID=UPI00376FF7CF